jgi:hypothetical protein
MFGHFWKGGVEVKTWTNMPGKINYDGIAQNVEKETKSLSKKVKIKYNVNVAIGYQ